MTEVVFAIPGDIGLPTGGYAYDRRVLALLPSMGIEASRLQLPGSFPEPTPADLAASERLLTSAPQGAVLLIDGLAYGTFPPSLIRRLARPVVALVHHPLCLEAGLSDARQAELRALEHEALQLASAIVVTSHATASTLHSDFAVPPTRITVAQPGTDPALRARGTREPLRLLAVGSIVPRKAFDVLVRALAPLRDRHWRLDIVGPSDRSPRALAALGSAIAETGLQDRVALAGAADQATLDAYYDATDLFVMPSLYEGYGMVLAEALARGLPIVCTTGGAAADTVPDAAGLKVTPGDVQAFGDALGRVFADSVLRRRMADASWAAGQRLPRWDDTAHRIAGVLRRAVP